jgi:eukaryotic-like serine/threonine-protein kinase
MAELDDEHVVDTIRTYVRQHSDIKVFKNVNRGLNGDVYFGKRTKLDDEVVLKFYWSYPNFDASEEAVILRKIDHPNILKVLDLRFVNPNYAYFLSPRIDGGDLQEHIDKRAISSKEALEIIAGILAGITELHSNHQLVHRDLKPGNILLDTKKNIPIIADLGAVRKVDSTVGYTLESKTTLYYLPPESIVDKKYYFQSDIYQVGLIMFQLLGGYFPINEPMLWLKKKEKKEIESIRNESKKYERFDELIQEKIHNGKLAEINTLPSYLDQNFKRVVNKALHWDCDKRFKNASEFLREVHKLLSSCPDYAKNSNYLLITHSTGKEYRVFEEAGYFYLEKKLLGKEWRRDNNHDNEFDSVLTIARQS